MKKGPPFTRKPKHGTWEFFCEHANEVPNVCPCKPTCGCRYYHCKTRSRVPEQEPTTPRGLNSLLDTPVVSARRKTLPRPTVRKGDPNQVERGKGRSGRAVLPAAGAPRACRRSVELAFKAGWDAGYQEGERAFRMEHPTSHAAWAEFVGNFLGEQ